MGAIHQLHAQHQPPAPPAPPALTYLTDAFVARLQAFNAMTRALRGAGIEIQALIALDNRIYIRAEDSDLVKSNFMSEVKGMRYRTVGKYTHNVVTIRGVDVAWLTPVREQDQ